MYDSYEVQGFDEDVSNPTYAIINYEGTIFHASITNYMLKKVEEPLEIPLTKTYNKCLSPSHGA